MYGVFSFAFSIMHVVYQEIEKNWSERQSTNCVVFFIGKSSRNSSIKVPQPTTIVNAAKNAKIFSLALKRKRRQQQRRFSFYLQFWIEPLFTFTHIIARPWIYYTKIKYYFTTFSLFIIAINLVVVVVKVQSSKINFHAKRQSRV